MFESRTSELSESEFRKILNEKCKDFTKNPKLLQRSKKRPSSKFTYIDPKQSERVPGGDTAVGSKHHLLLMDNLPSWSGFPRRSRSIIGVTAEDPRTLFGKERFLVIPFDGAKFGVAPSCDLWSCQVNIPSSVPSSMNIISFDETFSQMLRVNKISDKSYSQMIMDLQKLYDSETSKSWKDSTRLGNLFSKIRENRFDIIEDGLSDFLSPEKFKGSDIDDMIGFNIMNYLDLTKLSDYDFYEFWTESECLLFNLGDLRSGSEIVNLYDKFIYDFIK
jgi:hypothetical protein